MNSRHISQKLPETRSEHFLCQISISLRLKNPFPSFSKKRENGNDMNQCSRQNFCSKRRSLETTFQVYECRGWWHAEQIKEFVFSHHVHMHKRETLSRSTWTTPKPSKPASQLARLLTVSSKPLHEAEDPKLANQERCETDILHA